MIINIRQFDPQTDTGLVTFQDDLTVIRTGDSEMTASFTEAKFSEYFIPDGCWLALNETDVIGAILLGNCTEDEQEYTTVYGVTVDEQFRRKGIGGLLMMKADLHADRSGLKKIVVRTTKENIPAKNFFEKCWFKIAETTEDTLTMVKTRVRRR